MIGRHAFSLPLTVLVASLPLAVCSQSGELSRSEAAEAISKQLNEVSPETKPLAMNESQFGAGVSQGYWNIDGILTAKGQEHFSSVGISGSDIRLFLRRPHEFEIEVTGIRQDNADATTATAEFTVSNESLTGVARRFVLTDGVGEATFQRFDDGWRLQNVSSVNYPVATNGVGGELTLSASEKQTADREAAEQQAAFQKRVTAAHAEGQRAIYRCTDYRGMGMTFEVTDASFASQWSNSPNRHDVWYGGVKSYSEPYINGPGKPKRWDVHYIYGANGTTYSTYNSSCPDFEVAVRDFTSRFNAWRERFPDFIPASALNENGH